MPKCGTAEAGPLSAVIEADRRDTKGHGQLRGRALGWAGPGAGRYKRAGDSRAGQGQAGMAAASSGAAGQGRNSPGPGRLEDALP